MQADAYLQAFKQQPGSWGVCLQLLGDEAFKQHRLFLAGTVRTAAQRSLVRAALSSHQSNPAGSISSPGVVQSAFAAPTV